MGHAQPTVWLQSTQPSSGCGHCLAADSGPKCRSLVTSQACAQPQLAGRAEQLQQVMQALNHHVVDPAAGRGIVDLQWVKALRIGDGEAELTLSFAPACGPGKELSESAFQTLRRLLPDTDVYVRHDA
jgi:metal-sulfur cluster biosynthetic enzyme